MISPNEIQNLISTLNGNQWVIDKQTEGLSHEQSMIQPPFRANCMNWVIGHIAEHRDWMLRAIDETTLMPAKQVELYRRGSEELQAGDEVVRLEILLDYLHRSKDCLVAKIESATVEFLSEKPQHGVLFESLKEKTRIERLQGLIWHETYHVGQLELLRQLAGTDDAIL